MAVQTNRLRAAQPDYVILTLVVALLVLGLITVYSSSFALGLLAYNDVTYFVVRQAVWAVLGLVALVFLMRTDYQVLRQASPALMAIALVGLVAVLVPGIGVERNGATRWIGVGSLPPAQPSEFAKLALIVYVAAWLSSQKLEVKSFAMGFVPFVLLVGLVAGLVMLEPDMGTTLIIVLIMMTLFFVAGGSLTHLAALVLIGAVMGGLLILFGDYRLDRLFSFTSAEADPEGRGFHILQLLIALGSGGINGLGIGASRQKFFYVPGSHTDGAFAILGEELGFIGAVLVIALFAFLIYRGFRTIVNARDDFGALLTVGVISWIAYQALINVGGITRSIPLTGVPLPFLSYGGSALAALLAGIGIVLSVSRYGRDKGYLDRERRVLAPARVARPSDPPTGRTGRQAGGRTRSPSKTDRPTHGGPVRASPALTRGESPGRRAQAVWPTWSGGRLVGDGNRPAHPPRQAGGQAGGKGRR
jgi:cell division protein FtsW